MYQTYFVGKKATDRPMEMSIGLYVAKGISYREFLYADYPFKYIIIFLKTHIPSAI